MVLCLHSKPQPGVSFSWKFASATPEWSKFKQYLDINIILSAVLDTIVCLEKLITIIYPNIDNILDKPVKYLNGCVILTPRNAQASVIFKHFNIIIYML